MTQINIIPDSTNPSTADIIDGFARAFDQDPRLIPFRVESADIKEDKINIQINRLAYESGIPGMFIIGGNLQMWGQEKSIPIEGFYDANSRRGHLNKKAIQTN